MEKTYELTAGALLYSLIRLHKKSIFGVENVFSAMDKSDIPAFVSGCEQELMDKGLGSMDFSGTLSLDPDFAELLARCADAGSAAGVGLKRSGEPCHLTIYLTGDVCPALIKQENGTYQLIADADPLELMIGYLNMPESAEAIKDPVSVDSTLIEKRDIDGLIAAGCTSELAHMIADASKNKESFIRLTRANQNAQLAEIDLLSGKAGTYVLGAEYTQTEELIRFAPLTPEGLKKICTALIMGEAA